MATLQYGFDFEVERCVQCHACEIACKSLHQAEPGITWRRVVGVWNGNYPKTALKTLSLACAHCGEPACVAACPRGAITKRAVDGIVLVNKNKCIGCRTCFLACPFGVPQFGSDGKMQKCDLCADRLAQGKEPACVATCPADALHFGPLDLLSAQKTERVSHDIVKTLLPFENAVK